MVLKKILSESWVDQLIRFRTVLIVISFVFFVFPFINPFVFFLVLLSILRDTSYKLSRWMFAYFVIYGILLLMVLYAFFSVWFLLWCLFLSAIILYCVFHREEIAQSAHALQAHRKKSADKNRRLERKRQQEEEKRKQDYERRFVEDQHAPSTSTRQEQPSNNNLTIILPLVDKIIACLEKITYAEVAHAAIKKQDYKKYLQFYILPNLQTVNSLSNELYPLIDIKKSSALKIKMNALAGMGAINAIKDFNSTKSNRFDLVSAVAAQTIIQDLKELKKATRVGAGLQCPNNL